MLDLDKLLVGAGLFLNPDFVGVPGRLEAGVVDFEEAAAFFFCAAVRAGVR